MLTLITGGSKCGKSAIAEKILSSFGGKKYYIATMEPFGDEAQAAIERHREMRMGKGFETVEKYTDIHDTCLLEGSGVLLECLCNLLANEMFSASEKEPVKKILAGTDHLCKCCSQVIVVTNQVGEDGLDYPCETMEYIKNLGKLNALLAHKADCVIEAVYGISVYLKGKDGVGHESP